MRQKLFAILISSAMVLSLAGCGSGAGKTVQQPDEVDAEGTTLFKGFVAIVDMIGTMTYDEAAEYVESLGYPIDVEDADIGEITTENDENGFHLIVHTYENESGEETVYTAAYTYDGIYEVSADDDMHRSSSLTYYTYDEYASDPLQKVYSLNDLIAYINDEVPELMTEHEAAVAEREEEIQALSEEETEFLKSLKADEPYRYKDYQSIMDILSYTNAGIEAIQKDYDAKTIAKPGTSNSSSKYYGIDSELFGAKGQYEMWVSSENGSILLMSFVPEMSESSIDNYLEFMEFLNNIMDAFGAYEGFEKDEDTEYYSWDAGPHVATLALETTTYSNGSRYTELDFIPNPDYEEINPDFHMKEAQ